MTIVRTIALGVLAGAAATFAKGKAEEQLQPLGEKLFPPGPGQKTALGADPAGHPENMPPSELVDRAQHAVTGRELSDEQRQKVSVPVHWATGVGFGTAYALAASREPRVRAGWGTVAGAALFATTHMSGLPAVGVQHPVWKLPKAWWVWEGGSHLIYGAALDGALRLLERGVGQSA